MSGPLWGGMHDALFNGNGIAKRLLLSVVAFSSVITAVITAIALYADYRRDLHDIDGAFEFVASSYAPTLSRSVWQFDADLVRSQLEGMLRLQDMEYAAVEVDGQVQWSAGTIASRHQLRRDIALTHQQGPATLTIGTLHVVASVDRALGRVWERALTELLGNGIKTLLVAGFLLTVFQYLLTRHLSRMARFLHGIDPLQATLPQQRLTLERPASGRWRPDILDTVADAVNSLLQSLQEARDELERSHRQVAESELRFRLGLEAAAAGLWDCDLAGQTILADAACARLLGLDPGDLRRELPFWRDLVHPDDLPGALTASQQHLQGASPHVHLELRIRHASLGWRWVSVRGRIAEHDAAGRACRAVGTLADIDDRKQAEFALRRAEETLRSSEARLLTLTAHTSALIYEIDRSGRVLFANRGGSAAGPAIGTLAHDWLPPELRPLFEANLRRAFGHGTRQHFELRLPMATQGLRHYAITIAPMQGAGAMTAALTALDITQLKQAEDVVREANRRLESRVRERTAELEATRDEAQRANLAKSEFLSRMSHELRTPMNAILGFAQILEMSGDEPRQLRWVGEIRHAGEHLLELIDELLDLARIEVGKLAVRTEPLSLDAIVSEAVSMCRPMVEARHIALSVDESAGGLSVVADRTRLRQILVNLLANAVKYNREGGSIQVRRQSQGNGRVRLSVSDSGAGIPPEQIRKLFIPFERLGLEDSTVQGTGIGLALCKRLAELMSCDLGVQSTPGVGSTFWIDLPMVATADAGIRHQGATPAQLLDRRVHVLYVEDNRANLALMQSFFAQRPDFQLTTASDGLRGLALAQTEGPDVILLDIQLPGMDGLQVLEALRNDGRTRDIPVIAVTAAAMPHDVARGKAAGFAAYVTKPIRLAELVRLIEELTARTST